MSEHQSQKTTHTLGKGILIIIWITAVFMVMIMYDIKTQLEQINDKMSNCQRIASMNDPANLQIVDAKDGTTPLYLIQRIPMPEIEMLPEDRVEPEVQTPVK